MAKICIQCNSKIGFFKTPIEGVYCTYDCRNDARREIERAQVENRRLAEAHQAKAQRAADEVRRSESIAKADLEKKSCCPKCTAPWSLIQGGGAMGLHVGDCATCGFSAEFLRVEPCPNCHAASLVVGPDETGRCPKCKFRSSYTRLSA